MRGISFWATAVAIAVALAAGATAYAKPHVIRAGNLFLKDDGGIAPKELPRHDQAPIRAHIDASIGTADGSHPPAVETLEIDFDRTIQVNAKGLPACRRGKLEARTTKAAKAACPRSVVGSGRGYVEVEFPEQRPFVARGPIVLFNGGARGRTTLLLVHAYVAVPTPTAVVATVRITRIRNGHYGLRSVSRIPEIAGGAGSVIKFRIGIARRFTRRGRKESYLTASCPTGRYYTRGNILFSDGARLRGVHILPCTPKR